MGFEVFFSGKFKKDFKRYKNKESVLDAIKQAVKMLSQKGHSGIPLHMKPHKLSRNYKGYWECHVLPNLLIIWEQEDKPPKKIYLLRVGSHSELF